MTDNIADLFAARAMSREILIGGADAASGSRLGGRPPAPLAANPPACPLCGGRLRYVLTLGPDLLSQSVTGGKSLSLLACQDYSCLAKSHQLIRPSSIVLVAQPDAPRATEATTIDSRCEGRRLLLAAPAVDPTRDGEVWTDASKLGGQPGFIQRWGPEEMAKAEAAQGSFLFQWSEVTLAASGVDSGPYVFDFGVVYVFSRLGADGVPTLEEPMAFWQSS